METKSTAAKDEASVAKTDLKNASKTELFMKALKNPGCVLSYEMSDEKALQRNKKLLEAVGTLPQYSRRFYLVQNHSLLRWYSRG
jgi:hypothetical protein